jgi:hypothetical protein
MMSLLRGARGDRKIKWLIKGAYVYTVERGRGVRADLI